MKLVLFDIDGTLVKAGHSGSRALDFAIKKMTGIDKVCSLIDLNGTPDKVNFEEAYRAAVGNLPSDVQMREITETYLARLPQEVEWSVENGKYELIAGIEKFLGEISKKSKVLLGLGTGNIEKGAFIKLAPSGLGKYFPYGGYGEDSRDRSQMLKKGVQRGCMLAGVPLSEAEVYIVGDTHKDVLAAKTAGYHSAVVIDGFGDIKKIDEACPEFRQNNFEYIQPWLDWLGLE